MTQRECCDRPMKPLSNMSMAMTMRRLGADQFTVHGFRGSFRSWAAEQKGDRKVPLEVAEICLAHLVGNKVTRAHLTTTVLELRALVMANCAKLVSPPPDTNVVSINRGAA